MGHIDIPLKRSWERHASKLIYPDKENEFEYLSLALHGFMKMIVPEDIIGWIVPHERENEINNLIEKKSIKKRIVWIDSDFKDTYNLDMK